MDTLDQRGLVDTKRVGIIGHSYGAFMVAHLLTHSELFATGIAKSGAYNRSLTPFGFQGLMKNDLASLGVDYTKYGYEK